MDSNITKWLESGNPGPCLYKKSTAQGASYIITRIPKTERMDYLFTQPIYNMAGTVSKSREFKYAGIWDSREHVIYDAPYCLKEMPELEKYIGRDGQEILIRMTESVRGALEQKVDGCRESLLMEEITDPSVSRDLEYNLQYELTGRIRRTFMEWPDKPVEELFPYRAVFDNRPLTHENSLIEYLEDPSAYAEKEADALFRKEKQQIISVLKYNKACMDAYREFRPSRADTCIRRIRAALQKINDAKTVKVTISKQTAAGERTLFKFKTETDPLLAHGGQYSAYRMEPSDRRKYYSLFGKHEDYHAEEIEQITYRNRPIYDKAWGDGAYMPAENPAQKGK